MRCIEIFLRANLNEIGSKININMRCIEIVERQLNMKAGRWININMRCIEMKEINKSEPTSYRLTLT